MTSISIYYISSFSFVLFFFHHTDRKCLLDKHKILSLYFIWEKSFYIFVCVIFSVTFFIIIITETKHLHHEQALLTVARKKMPFTRQTPRSRTCKICAFLHFWRTNNRLEDK